MLKRRRRLLSATTRSVGATGLVRRASSLFVIFTAVFYVMQVRAENVVTNRVVNRAIDQILPIERFGTRLSFRKIFFITNREVDESVEAAARSSGNVLHYEDVFLSKPAIAAAYGWLDVSYPSNRRRGQQNYGSNSVNQNPLHDFSVVDDEIINSPEEFQLLLNRMYEVNGNHPLIYVHGLDNSFTDAAERLTQLSLDVDHHGLSLLFSWPSDAGRLFPRTPALGLTKAEYMRTVGLARASQSYLVQTMRLLDQNNMVPFDVVAHSIGTDLAINATIIWDSFKKTIYPKKVDLPMSDASPAHILLAAPDISTKAFEAEIRPKIIRPKRVIVVYCSKDRALELSKLVNKSDERLGYCTQIQPPMNGIEIVSVVGAVNFANHSYYLQSVELLDDIENMLGDVRVPRFDPQTPNREIKLQ